MLSSLMHALRQRPRSGFLILCLTLLVGGLVVGTLLLLGTIEPLPSLPVKLPEQIA